MITYRDFHAYLVGGEAPAAATAAVGAMELQETEEDEEENEGMWEPEPEPGQEPQQPQQQPPLSRSAQRYVDSLWRSLDRLSALQFVCMLPVDLQYRNQICLKHALGSLVPVDTIWNSSTSLCTWCIAWLR